MIKTKIISLAIIICICFSPSLLGETIRLKSGRTMEGEVIERGKDYIRINFQGIALTYYFDQIKTIDGILPRQEIISPSYSSTKSASGPATTDLSESIRNRLKECGYPKHTRPKIEKELIAFYQKIGFPALQSKARSARGDPAKLKQLAQEILRIFKTQGLLNTQTPPPLIRLLVDSFGDDDILAVIQASPLSPAEKEQQKRNLYACSAISQLGGITLDLLGLSVKVVESITFFPKVGHVANYLELNQQEILLLDFLNQLFLTVDINHWYQKEGEYLVLKPQHRLSSQKQLELKRRFQQGITPEETKEVLNLLFSSLNLTGGYSSVLAMIYTNRGLAYQEKGDLNRAISDYNRALQINPNLVPAYNNRGLAYADYGDLNRAISDYNRALQINPNYAAAYNNRGFAYQEKGDLNQAISDYNRALQINPNYVAAYTNRAVVYYSQGNYRKAREDVRKVQQLGGSVNPDFLQILRRASEKSKKSKKRGQSHFS